LERLRNLDRDSKYDEEFNMSEIRDNIRSGNSTRKNQNSKISLASDSPMNSTYKDSLKKELKNNLEKVRSKKKGEGKALDTLREVSESSVTSFSRKLNSSRQTPKNEGNEVQQIKFSNSKKKIEVQNKIDFINSMFEELSLGEKPQSKTQKIISPEESGVFQNKDVNSTRRSSV
jgi:hypothetical protein